MYSVFNLFLLNTPSYKYNKKFTLPLLGGIKLKLIIIILNFHNIRFSLDFHRKI